VIRVSICDDDNVADEGLAQLLSDAGFEIVGDEGDGGTGLLAAAGSPDVLLMDLSVARGDGVAAIRRLRAAYPDLPVVVLTSCLDRDWILDSLDAGASGYLLKAEESAELVHGLHAAARGESPLSPAVGTIVLAARGRRHEEAELTAREREVLALVGDGLPNRRIADRLSISEKTVKAHLTRIFQRIGVADRTQAAIWAHRHGLAQPAHLEDGA
jgi:DNA-binding NarL/FixJ family response regulator